MKTLKIISAIIAAVFIVAATVVAAVFVAYFILTSDVKLDEEKLAVRTPACVIYADDGSIIEESVQTNYVEIDKIPDITKKAFIATEDKRFYNHGGVDFKGILRAGARNIFSGKLKEGGSTISQQLVKNAYLSGEKTLARKFKEIKLARLLEKRYSKDKILEIYLNTIYFGKGIYGISDAAKRYLGKDVSDIDAAESAILAGVIKSPRKYNPVDNFKNSQSRKNLILKLMREQNYLTDVEYNISKNKDIIIDFKTDYETHNELIDIIKKSACSKLGFENDAELNGYKIYTSISKPALSYIGKPSDYSIDCDYTVIIADAAKKKIIAYDSSVGDLKRCPASAAKPWLIYAPALEEKLISEATKISDEKINYGGYSPSNADGKYHGYVSAKEALSKSYNVPSVKLADALGIDKIKKYAKLLNVEFENDDLSVGLGNLSGGITISSLLSCYTPFINNGKYYEPDSVEKIIDPKGKVVYSSRVDERQVFSDSTAFIINDMLKETVKKGTAKKLSSFPFAICAKTGTNGTKQGNVDAYCVAYTTEHIIAVRLGNADGKKMDNTISGGNYPTLMVKDILENLYKTHSPKDFTIPDSVREIFIAKDEYEKNHKIAVTGKDDKNSLSFYFSADNLPTEKYEPKEISPDIKDYKIFYKNGEITISVTTNESCGFYILDDKMNVIFKSEKSADYIISNLEADTEYLFYVQPYLTSDGGKEIKGELKKLPTVKTDGRNKPIVDSPWWEE